MRWMIWNKKMALQLSIVPAMLMVSAVLGVASAEPDKQEILFLLGGERSYLGIEMEDVSADNMSTYKLTSERGVIVRSVEKGSPAEAATLQAKDVILEYAGTPVLSTMQLGRLVGETPPGRKVDLVVSRDGKRLTISVETGKRDAEGISRWFPPYKPAAPPDWQYRFEGPMLRRGPFAFALPGPRSGVTVVEPKPRLGVSLQPLTDQMADFLAVPGKKGVLITQVMDNTAAAGNLKAGDVVIEADGRTVEDPDDLTRVVQRKEEGEKLELKIIRDKKPITVTVELAKKEGTKKSGGYRM